MSAPFRIRPFQFAEIFEVADIPIDEADGEELLLRVATLTAELALARQDAEDAVARARAEGFDAGLAQARGEQAAALLVATDALHAAVEDVDGRLVEIAEEAARTAAEVTHVAAGMLAGRALAENPVAAIDEAIGRVLNQVARGQEVHVAVHPDLVPAVEELIASRKAADRRRLALTAHGDASLAIGDAHVRWDGGGVVLDAEARATAVREALGGLLES